MRTIRYASQVLHRALADAVRWQTSSSRRRGHVPEPLLAMLHDQCERQSTQHPGVAMCSAVGSRAGTSQQGSVLEELAALAGLAPTLHRHEVRLMHES